MPKLLSIPQLLQVDGLGCEGTGSGEGAKFTVWLTETAFNMDSSDSLDSSDESDGSDNSDGSEGAASFSSSIVSSAVVSSGVSDSSVAVVSSGG